MNYRNSKRAEGKGHQGFIVQPSQSDNLTSSQMSISSSGKLSSMIQNKARDSIASKESLSNSGYFKGGNFGFGIGRHEKLNRKERKEPMKSSRESLKFINRSSIEKNKINPRKSEISPKIEAKSIKIVKNRSSLTKKILKKDHEEKPAPKISEASPSPNQCLNLK